MNKREVWITDNSNFKYQKIKTAFIEAMLQQTKDQKINYYDFLLVAKQLNFRFEESGHLMALKNYFSKNKNVILIKKIADLLCVSQQSVHMQEQKIIVKFIVPDTEFAPIKEQTHEDEQFYSEEDVGSDIFEKIGSELTHEQEKEIQEKMAIILSIKVEEMQKKIKSITNQKDHRNLIEIIKQSGYEELNFDEFKHIVVELLADMREKIKMSEDDIKTIFYVLDSNKLGKVRTENVQKLRIINDVTQQLRQFYKSRINKDMVRNTLFKLGKVKNNTIQIYQVKNASVLQFENMQQAILEDTHPRQIQRLKPAKAPHFGPHKGAALAAKQKQSARTNQNFEHRASQPGIKIERQRIQKILRVSKEEKRKDKKGDTVASKLRSLFIHKVILPRQRMLQEEKERYLRQRAPDAELFVKAHR